MKKKSLKGWLYLLPAILFLGCFMVYPLIDVLIYSVEEADVLNMTTTSETATGIVTAEAHGYDLITVTHPSDDISQAVYLNLIKMQLLHFFFDACNDFLLLTALTRM